MMVNYTCKKCNVIKEAKKEIKGFRCKGCGYYNFVKKDDGTTSETATSDDAQNEPADIDLKTENIKVEIPKFSDITPISEPQNKPLNQSISQKGFSEDTVKKYFNAVDKMMKGKTSEWDITEKEEEMLGNLWADYANDKFKDYSQEKSKLAIASITTATIYLPRIAMYLKKIYEQKNRKAKKQEEEAETPQKETELYQVTDRSETEKELGDWANRKPIGGN